MFIDLFFICDKRIRNKNNSPISYKELALVEVFAAPVGIFDFFAKDQGHLKQEEVSVATLSDKSLGIPDLEGFLKYQLSLGVNVSVKSWKVAARSRNERFSCICGCAKVCPADAPSSIDRCMASLAFFGTLSITSRPSLISPLPSSQHVNSSCARRMQSAFY